MKTKGKLILLAGLALAASGGGWWWWQAGNRLGLTAAALPATPDLSASPEVLQARIATAEIRARQRFSTLRGLADLSRLYHANGFLDEAMRCYAGLEQLAPAEPRWPHLHAHILAGYGEIEPALQLWRQVVKLAPAYGPARLRLGDGLLKANRPDEAAAVYAAVLKQSPTDSYALLGLARIDLEASRWDQARERLETVVRQSNYELGYDLIVSLYERIGRHDQATAIRGSAKASGAYRDPPDPWLDGLMDDCFDPYRLSLAAGVAARTGEPAAGIRLLERAMELNPGDVAYHFQLGGIYLALRDLPAARAQFDRCTVLAPDFADGWANLSALQAQAGEDVAAARTLQTGLSHCPESPGLHLMQARTLREAGQIAAAISEFQASIRLRPNEPDAYVELGNTYIGAGQEREGIAQLHQALEADPGDPAALGTLTFFAITTGDEAEARRWFARVSLQPRMPRPKVERLAEAFRQTFGHAWVPDPPR